MKNKISLIDLVREELKQKSDLKTRDSNVRFFKEEIKLYGVKSADVNKISKKYYKDIKEKTKTEVFSLCEELWKSGYLEESFVACRWSYSIYKKFEEKDIEVLMSWISNYVNNWASCDTLCNHTVGAFLEMYPLSVSVLKGWAISGNRWMRRASAVSLIIPARKGLFLKEIIEIADILILDEDDLVRKGYGWMLKSAGEFNQNLIFDYVMSRKALMPRTSLRYSVEKFPADLKQKAMEK